MLRANIAMRGFAVVRGRDRFGHLDRHAQEFVQRRLQARQVVAQWRIVASGKEQRRRAGVRFPTF